LEREVFKFDQSAGVREEERLGMSDDTYKGESLQKKIARIAVHTTVRDWQENRYPGAFDNGMHVFLCSREGGDIGVLATLGVKPQNMVGIDRCEEAIRMCDEKWSSLPGFGDVNLIHGEDAATELAYIRNCIGKTKGQVSDSWCNAADCWIEAWAKKATHPYISSVFWDFCSHIDKDTADTFTDTWRRLHYGSVLSVAFLKGREKRQADHRVGQAPATNHRSRRVGKAIHGDTHGLIVDMMSGRAAWDCQELLKRINNDAGTQSPEGARWLLTFYLLSLCDQSAQPLPVLVCSYQSRTATSNGVPMLVLSFAKGRLPKRLKGWRQQYEMPGEPPIHIKIGNSAALRSRNHILLNNDTETAALMLNVPRSTAIAWKAHVTRGTYSQSAAE
jgi:hypothetical protein